MKKQRTAAVLFVIAAMTLSVFSGCAGKNEKPEEPENPAITGEEANTLDAPNETESETEPEEPEKAVYLPKSVTYYYDGVFDSRHEYEYDDAGNKTKEEYYFADENGETSLSMLVETEYDADGNPILYRSYNTEEEEPFVTYEVKYIYENGAEVKSEEYSLLGTEMVMTAYAEYENDDRKRPVKVDKYGLNYGQEDESSGFDLYSETVYSYKGDFEQPVSIRTETFSEKAFFSSETTTVELDDQGRELVRESSADTFGMREVSEYDGDFLTKKLHYTFDAEISDWRLIYTAAYTYNGKGNCTEELDTYESGSAYKTVYEYDESGEKLLTESESEPDEETGKLKLSVYEY